jgi:hypothetical protein
MATEATVIQVIRFQSIGDARVPLPRLVEVLGGIDGFRHGVFLTPREGEGAMGVLLWDDERALQNGFAALRERLGAQPPRADVEIYRVVGMEVASIATAGFARATTRQFPSPAHHAAWRANVADRIVPALRTLDAFQGVLWGERPDGSAGFAFELWDTLPPEGGTHAAVAEQPVAASLDPTLLNTPVLREGLRVVATAPVAVRA